MSPAIIFVLLLLSVSFWRQLLSLLAAGGIVLIVIGLMAVAQALSTST